jgi:hypothetical protein
MSDLKVKVMIEILNMAREDFPPPSPTKVDLTKVTVVRDKQSMSYSTGIMLRNPGYSYIST